MTNNNEVKQYEAASCPVCGELVLYDSEEIKYVLVCQACGEAIILGGGI